MMGKMLVRLRPPHNQHSGVLSRVPGRVAKWRDSHRDLQGRCATDGGEALGPELFKQGKAR